VFRVVIPAGGMQDGEGLLMRRRISRKSSVLLSISLASAAGFAVGSAAWAAAAPATLPSWHVLETVHGPGQDFGAVVATGPASGWAFVDNASYAYERTGVTTWKEVPFPGRNGVSVAVAAASSASDVWAFTDIASGAYTNFASTRSEAVELASGKWTVRKTLVGYVSAVSVLAADDVWVFGDAATYHYNGSTWVKVAGGAFGGSALSASDYWLTGAYGQTTVTHVKNGTKATFNLAGLLPAKTKKALDFPAVAGVYAASDTNVYVVGDGGTQDSGGPVAVLHYDGHAWKKLAGYPTGGPGGITPDGAGGLWIPVGWAGGGTILHYSRGVVTAAALPNPGQDESTNAGGVSRIPGTTRALAITITLPFDAGRRFYSQILQYG
ncbi:MAG TPA: hypothetical protein VIX15_09435, partial [Streptosporangiaceae bacterium]